MSNIRYSVVGEGQELIMLMYLPRVHYWPLIKINEFPLITEGHMISVEPESKYNDISLVEEVQSEKRKFSENIQDQLDKKRLCRLLSKQN